MTQKTQQFCLLTQRHENSETTIFRSVQMVRTHKPIAQK